MTTIAKAKTEDLRAVYQIAWDNAVERWQRSELAHYAGKQGHAHLLPDAAHEMLHESGIAHKHADTEQTEVDTQGDPIGAGHVHRVTKARNYRASEGRIEKAWADDASPDTVFFEGWMSTPHLDLEKDVTEPEAFIGCLDEYFARSAPLSIEHNDKALPVGHLQKAAVLRDGKVLKESVHPSDPAEFTRLPASGSGVWVRGVANEAPGSRAIRKGNVSGMSFVADYVEYEPLPGGRKRYTRIDPLIESTVAAYPVNPKAAFRIAKAFGLEPDQEHMTPMEKTLEEILAEAAERANAKRLAEESAARANTVQKGISVEELGDLFAQFSAKIEQKIEQVTEAKIVKALPAAARPDGAGRKGAVAASTDAAPALSLDSDPVKFLLKKARKGEELTQDEKAVATDIWKHVMGEGMVGDGSEDLSFDD